LHSGRLKKTLSVTQVPDPQVSEAQVAAEPLPDRQQDKT
jgi:hypothetical protein